MTPVDAEPESSPRSGDNLVSACERIHGAYQFFSTFVAERRASPGEDLASAMLKLTDEEDGPPVRRGRVSAPVAASFKPHLANRQNCIWCISRHFA
jgi:hypothetical protein